jgi:hypothetical protein
MLDLSQSETPEISNPSSDSNQPLLPEGVIWTCEKNHRMKTSIESDEFFVPKCKSCTNPRKPDKGRLVYKPLSGAEVGITYSQAKDLRKSYLWTVFNDLLQSLQIRSVYGDLVTGSCKLCQDVQHNLGQRCDCSCHPAFTYLQVVKDTLK